MLGSGLFLAANKSTFTPTTWKQLSPMLLSAADALLTRFTS